MSLTALSTLIPILTGVLFLLVTLMTFRTRRLGREARELRELRVTNVAYARRMYAVDLLAAREGWDTHPGWPPIPKELSVDYLAGKAEGEGNIELARIVDVIQALEGQPKPGHP
ncbi:MAG TPA: hypothetical protein VGH72_33805 [Pseudonocardia sp.]|jgi:hypothetical protein